MPIIKKIESETDTFKITISKKVFHEIERYCSHFDCSMNEFMNQAAEYVLKKDADWKKVKNPQKEKA